LHATLSNVVKSHAIPLYPKCDLSNSHCVHNPLISHCPSYQINCLGITVLVFK
jgi:hypothetical protein